MSKSARIRITRPFVGRLVGPFDKPHTERAILFRAGQVVRVRRLVGDEGERGTYLVPLFRSGRYRGVVDFPEGYWEAVRAAGV